MFSFSGFYGLDIMYELWARITCSLDLVIAFSSFIGLLSTDQKTLLIRYLSLKTVKYLASVGFKNLII